IDFMGRIDRQVNIRGFRIELGEIENRLLEHEDVKEVVVIDREEKGGEKTLCAYVVSRQPETTTQLREYLSGKLPDYMVPAYFIPIETIPLNQNGKVERKALPELETGTTGIEYIAPRDELEKKLTRIWSQILKKKKETISINDNFFELGGHSLKATTMMSGIHKEIEVKLSLEEIFKNLTVKQLAQAVRNKKKKEYKAIEPAEKKEYYELTSAQKRLYILQQMDESSTGYNMCDAIMLEGTLDRKKLEKTFSQMIARHESLRTTFQVIDGQPVQLINPQKEIEFVIENYETGEEGQEGTAAI
ncbi:MAG: hypothetical protein GY757_58775, partial [bacterium]|nr:hypothetical protein [bacterium]